MKKLFIVANWKSYETNFEAIQWIAKFSDYNFATLNNKEIIVCPPFTVLSELATYIRKNKLPVRLGAQNVSPFPKGAHTGEVNAEEIKVLGDYVIIGHSERRNEFGEDDEMLKQKVNIAIENGLMPIFCVQGVETCIPEGVEIVAYEPVFAIGTGKPDTPENANDVIGKIKEINSVEYVLYGGSVTPENVDSFTSKKLIDGVLVGGASLDPDKFFKIIENS